MKKASDELVRLQRVLVGDSLKLPSGVVGVLKNDLKTVLSGYFELTDDPDLSIEVRENGAYILKIEAKATGAKTVTLL